jgi:hypothetical protein
MSSMDCDRWSARSRRRFSSVVAALAVCFASALSTREAGAQVALPPPDPGSRNTVFDLLPNGKLIAFTGSEIRLQSVRGESAFHSIGTLPPQYVGKLRASFLLAHPGGQFFLLGAGSGGSSFPGGDEPFSGEIFMLPKKGGRAKRIANVQNHNDAAFYGNSGALISRTHEDEYAGWVEHVALPSGKLTTLIADIPKIPGAVAVDRWGNVFASIGFDDNADRGGEIRRFARKAVQRALRSGVALDFEADGVYIGGALTAAGLVFDRDGHLWVSGGEEGQSTPTGYLAEVDPATTEILRRVDPQDGDPDDGEDSYFDLAIDEPRSCRVVTTNAFDLSEPTLVYEIDACGEYGSAPYRSARVSPDGYTWSNGSGEGPGEGDASTAGAGQPR